MFDKKCSKCSNKVKKEFEFCPFCGSNLNLVTDREDYGILGKNDFIKESKLDLNNSFFDSLIKNVMKDIPSIIKTIEKQVNEQQHNNKDFVKFPNNLNVQFFVNGKRISPNENFERKIPIVKNQIKLSRENQEKLISLPREIPESKVRRISGKVVYELSLPGVNNIEDVLITKLENSFEIKAIGVDKVYTKNINVNLPIIGIRLNQENLIIEFPGQ